MTQASKNKSNFEGVSIKNDEDNPYSDTYALACTYLLTDQCNMELSSPPESNFNRRSKKFYQTECSADNFVINIKPLKHEIFRTDTEPILFPYPNPDADVKSSIEASGDLVKDDSIEGYQF